MAYSSLYSQSAFTLFHTACTCPCRMVNSTQAQHLPMRQCSLGKRRSHGDVGPKRSWLWNALAWREQVFDDILLSVREGQVVTSGCFPDQLVKCLVRWFQDRQVRIQTIVVLSIALFWIRQKRNLSADAGQHIVGLL